MNNYSEKTKEAMVMKLTSPEAPSACALAQEVEISQSTLSRWVREYAMVGKAGGVMKERRPQDWTAEEKLDAVLEYEKLEEERRGVYLREKGLHSVHIERWKSQIIEGLKGLKGKNNFITDVRGRGLLIAVEFDGEIAQSVLLGCLERGLLVNRVKPNAIRLIPPLIIGYAEVDRAIGILTEALSGVVR